MRCGRCRKNFDEEMYSGVCPNCGHFNNRQTEYDVSKYFSAKFDDSGKTSTSTQAAKQHEKLHQIYDDHDMHKKPGSQHEKLHEMYDRSNVHKLTVPSSGSRQAGNYQSGVSLGKTNPYQPATVQGGTYPVGQTGSRQQKSFSKPAQYGQSVKVGSELKKKNIVTPLCIVIAVLAILITVFSIQWKKTGLSETYNTLEYEQQYAGAGEVFEIRDRLLMVEKAEVIDTSKWPDLAVGEKLIAVTVEVLPTDDWERDYSSNTVYVSDGYSCKQYLDSYVLNEFLNVQDVLTGYDYLSYSSAEGMTGRFYFFVDYRAEEITISFDQDKEEDSIFVLQKRVSVPLQLEEEGS